MQVTNCGRGVHTREIKGVERLKALPKDWYAFTNLELATGIGRSRELDVIIVTDHMIFLVDLKDWSGTIESDSGNWLHNGRDTGPSPVAKIHSNVKDVLRLLTTELRSRPESKSSPIPKIVGVVVITGKASLSMIAATERSSVFEIDDFLKTLGSEKTRRAAFGNVAPQILADPLTSAVWKSRLAKFFNVKVGPFKPGRSRYDRYVATSDQATFEHPNGIYREYEAEEENTPQNLGTLRLWNFANCKDGRFQTEEGRAEIAGREGKVFYYLRDRNEDCANWILVPKAADPNQSVSYWEVYDRRRRLKRLRDFISSEGASLSAQDRIELTRRLHAWPRFTPRRRPIWIWEATVCGSKRLQPSGFRISLRRNSRKSLPSARRAISSCRRRPRLKTFSAAISVPRRRTCSWPRLQLMKFCSDVPPTPRPVIRRTGVPRWIATGRLSRYITGLRMLWRLTQVGVSRARSRLSKRSIRRLRRDLRRRK